MSSKPLFPRDKPFMYHVGTAIGIVWMTGTILAFAWGIFLFVWVLL